jgi:hypothetical protein
MGVGGQRHATVALPPEAELAPRPVWTGAENLAPTGIRYLDRPARSESLYRLHYPGPQRGPWYEVFYLILISFCDLILHRALINGYVTHHSNGRQVIHQINSQNRSI